MPERTDRHGWIDLLVPDGPFLSTAALDIQTVGENWPTRLSAEQRGLLLATSASQTDDGQGWDDSSWEGRRARVLELLTELLGYREGKTLTVAPNVSVHHHIYRTRVSADFLIHAPNDAADARMLVICGPDTTDDPGRLNPSQTKSHDGWVSTPGQRAALLARHAGADLALVTNGREHLLVNVVTGTTGSAMWTVNGLEDRHARDAFVALLHKQRVLHRSVPLSRLIELSQDRQHELTDTLGKQIRRAAEGLVNAISRANRTSHGRLLDGLTGQQVYAATTRVLMRTVFLLVAEERGLLPVAENQLYADQYAMSTLLDKLEEDVYRNRSAMERRSGAWQRIMALSRAVDSGIEHDDLRLPAYGGNIFDPDEHPFLEARATNGEDGFTQLDVGVVDDFTVLTVLRHLQIANGQRISFRSLDVEQIGHVYEALLDHSAVIVPDEQIAVLGLVGRAGDEPEVPLVDLDGWQAKSDKELGKQLAGMGVAAETKGVYRILRDGLASDSQVAHTLNIAVANDETLRERVGPYAPLLRTDARGVALVFLPGDVYVTETADRSDSASYYTPRGLVSEILDAVFEPAIADALSGVPASEQESALLTFSVCDPACGSGAFLVGAARRLAAHLEEARRRAPSHPGPTGREIRDVISRCLYGADIDPMAIQLAKLSLWIESCGRDEPLNFLDHHFVVGDSLIGVHVEELAAGIPDEAFLTSKLDDRRILRSWLKTNRERRSGQGSLFDGDVVVDLSEVREATKLASEYPDATIDSLAVKQGRLAAAHSDPELVRARYMADAWCSAFTTPATEANASPVETFYSLQHGAKASIPVSPERRFVHWELAFPELEPENGALFDVVIGNPPYLRGREHSQTDPKGRAFSSFRWKACTGSNWNLYMPFVLLAAGLSKRRSGLLVQSSVLGAQYSDQLHAELLDRHGLQACLDFSAVPSLFHDATVRVACLVVVPSAVTETAFVRFGEGLRIDREVDVSKPDLGKLPHGCWSLPTSGLEEQTIALFLEPALRLSDVADISDGMTQGAAYDVRPLVHEAQGEDRELRLTTTGLIDPFVNHWGTRTVRYLKSTYERPVLDAAQLIGDGFPEMAEQGLSVKIGIAGLSNRIEAVVDERSALISKSAMVVRILDPDICPHAVAVVLNSRFMNEIYDGAFGSMVFGAGDKNYRPSTLGALPLPGRRYLLPSTDERSLSGLGRMIAATGEFDMGAVDRLTRAALFDSDVGEPVNPAAGGLAR